MNMGRNMKMPATENTSPPMVPAASENQNPLPASVTNGMKPRTVERTVSRIADVFECSRAWHKETHKKSDARILQLFESYLWNLLVELN